jgi:hypothetical protein
MKRPFSLLAHTRAQKCDGAAADDKTTHLRPSHYYTTSSHVPRSAGGVVNGEKQNNTITGYTTISPFFFLKNNNIFSALNYT